MSALSELRAIVREGATTVEAADAKLDRWLGRWVEQVGAATHLSDELRAQYLAQIEDLEREYARTRCISIAAAISERPGAADTLTRRDDVNAATTTFTLLAIIRAEPRGEDTPAPKE